MTDHGTVAETSEISRMSRSQEETAFAALEDVNIAIFSRKGKRADLSGTGGTLTLERR